MVEDMTKNLVKVPKSIAISYEEMPFFVLFLLGEVAFWTVNRQFVVNTPSLIHQGETKQNCNNYLTLCCIYSFFSLKDLCITAFVFMMISLPFSLTHPGKGLHRTLQKYQISFT